eukprot:TRINITY_DN4054_c0_g1_i1.p1 TRINITY_DN4054_c0_g1~~TRINITY_DN4054_c0_g1_i1.p1  ORF type:complete len:479 (-),score=84.04 TRINITY_DN4054_c0_g1_i1:25-1431(-)
MEVTSTVRVQIKWGKEKYDVDVDLNENGETFKSSIYSLTGVPPDRQKLMGLRGLKAGQLPDDTDMKTLGLKPGQGIMLVGTAGELPKAPEQKTVFYEDLSDAEKNIVVKPPTPPGLHNLGNTCYLNATLQCLKAIPELVSSLNRYSGQNQLTKELKGVFQQLDHSVSSLPPFLFVELFRTLNPRFAQRGDRGGYVQQDADEFYGELLSNLSQSLPALGGATSGNAVQDLFSGEMITEFKSQDSASTRPEPPRLEAFTKLMCNIDEQTNFLITGLKRSMKGALTKQSAELGREVDYEKTSHITKLPFYVMVQFVRFYYKRETQVAAKICRPVEFPFELDLYELCSESLQEELAPRRKLLTAREEARKEREHSTAGPDAATTDLPPLWDQQPNKNETGRYELFGLVTHKGRSADSGHYVGWVKEGTDAWLCFDDENVKPCKDEDIKALAGKGGADWHIAYMCFYRSKKVE